MIKPTVAEWDVNNLSHLSVHPILLVAAAVAFCAFCKTGISSSWWNDNHHRDYYHHLYSNADHHWNYIIIILGVSSVVWPGQGVVWLSVGSLVGPLVGSGTGRSGRLLLHLVAEYLIVIGIILTNHTFSSLSSPLRNLIISYQHYQHCHHQHKMYVSWAPFEHLVLSNICHIIGITKTINSNNQMTHRSPSQKQASARLISVSSMLSLLTYIHWD